MGHQNHAETPTSVTGGELDVAPWRRRFFPNSEPLGEEFTELPPKMKNKIWVLIPDDVVVLVLISSSEKHFLRAIDIQRLVCTSKRFSFLASSEDLWSHMTSHFLELVAGMQPNPSASPYGAPQELCGIPENATKLEVYKEMARREECRRCGTRYHRGANFAECMVHPGVMISGHRMNGLSATWTCCGQRRQSEGCKNVFHEPATCTDRPCASYGEARTQAESWRGRHANSNVTCLDLISRHGCAGPMEVSPNSQEEAHVSL